MSEDIHSFWQAQQVALQSLSANERAVRDKFVKEYLYDYNQVEAAIRIGFPASFAASYAERFMGEPYVLQKIAEAELADADELEQLETDRRRIRAALLREAHFIGPGASHAARVNALGKMASILDMDAPVKIKSETTVRGGVMAVPAIASLEEWEKAAVSSQQKLQQDASV